MNRGTSRNFASAVMLATKAMCVHRVRLGLPLCLTSRRISSASPRLGYYEDLGLTREATSADIKKAYYTLSKIHHPDVSPDDPEARKAFLRISEAYAVLGEPRFRRLYDKKELGLDASVADLEAMSHKVEGDDFLRSRTSFKKEYVRPKSFKSRGETSSTESAKVKMDAYVDQYRSHLFVRRLKVQLPPEQRRSKGGVPSGGGGGAGGGPPTSTKREADGGGGTLFVFLLLAVICFGVVRLFW